MKDGNVAWDVSLIKELRAAGEWGAADEIERCHKRLEINYEAPAYDGIECRDETIKIQDAQLAELRLRFSDGNRARLEEFAASPACHEANAIDAGRWYFLTMYVSGLTRRADEWICYYRRQPNGEILEGHGDNITSAVKTAMDDVERFEKMELE